VAKLRACRAARDAGVRDVVITDGRSPKMQALVAGKASTRGHWTRLT
jgi:hypothetical protein